MLDDEPYLARYSIHYLDQLDSRQYRQRRAEIERRLFKLLEEPYAAARAERLRHRFSGLRSARIDQSTRVIYRICAECRGSDAVEHWRLDCCKDGLTPARTVNVLCLSEHYSDMPTSFAFDS